MWGGFVEKKLEPYRRLRLLAGALAPRSGARKLARVRVFCVPLEYVDNSGIRTLKGCRGLLAPFQGAAVFGFRQPGVALAPARLIPG